MEKYALPFKTLALYKKNDVLVYEEMMVQWASWYVCIGLILCGILCEKSYSTLYATNLQSLTISLHTTPCLQKRIYL